jgi:hypothetical protein
MIAVRKKYRKIVVYGVQYHWIRRHGHIGTSSKDRICVENFTVRRSDNLGGRCVIRFIDGCGGNTLAGGGYGYDGGIVTRPDGENVGNDFNLNLPSVAAELIRAALESGWQPTDRGDFVIEDGFAFVEEYNLSQRLSCEKGS